MEKGTMSWEQKELVNELIQGMEVATKLKVELMLPSSADTSNLLVQRILSSYDKALLLLGWNASLFTSQAMLQVQPTKTWSPESPFSRSTTRESIEGTLKDHHELKHDSKKRKMMPKNGFEGPYERWLQLEKIRTERYPWCQISQCSAEIFSDDLTHATISHYNNVKAE
ncbi:hypothetical protein RIF29_33021 [Crotalaria pallida]|uniref:Uncharacterized protein n=1 Tax=Crotalaria pallida TaxID=3830 RepID=A0AAN9E7V8_CROPI